MGLGRWLVAGLGLALAGCVSHDVMRPPDRPVEHHSAIDAPVIHTDLPYEADGNPAHTLDLYLPAKGKGTGALVMFIHGGAWISGDKSGFSGLGKRFANAGYAMAIINYRLSGDSGVKSPEHVKDAAVAYKWLAAHAKEYRYADYIIYVVGHSAGAHTLGMLVTGPFLKDAGVKPDQMPAGCIGLEGIYDIPDLNHKFPKYKDWFLAKAFGNEANWAKLSPSRRKVVEDRAWLLIQSNQDELVDKGQTVKFKEHLLAAPHIQLVDTVMDDLGTHDDVVDALSETSNKTDKIIIEWMSNLEKARE